jgi:hypothetical protein
MRKASCALCLGLLLIDSASAQQQTFEVSNTTPDCRTGNKAVHEVCLPEGQRVAGAPTVNTISQAGSASIESSGPAPGKPNCWQITTAVQPNGEDCLNVPLVGRVCNCKGRGWINLNVRLTPAQ